MTHQAQESMPESPADTYENFMVPAMFAKWIPAMLGLMDLRGGESVLDVGCGTGIVARSAAQIVRSRGRAVGLDFNVGMLEKARSLDSTIEWVEANAMDMPFADAEFDVVVCQQSLQFVPDRLAAVKEMYRVLKTAGRIVLACWFSLEETPGHYAIVRALAHHISTEVAILLNGAFSLEDEKEITTLLERAGFSDIHINNEEQIARFPSPESFTRTVLRGSVLGRSGITLSNDTINAIIGDVNASLASYTNEGELAFPMKSHLAAARK